MQMLTTDSLKSAFARCSQFKDYRLGIVFDNKNKKDEFLSGLKESGAQVNMRKGTVRFKGKAGMAYIMCIADGAPKITLHELLFEDGAMNIMMAQLVYGRLMTSYVIDGDNSDSVGVEKELNNFLDAFKIDEICE